MSTKIMTRTGYVLSGLFAVFLAVASITPKFFIPDVATESMRQLGWPEDHVLLIGVIELACLVLYLFPRTAVLGAVLMTGLLGGAMASQLRVGNPLVSHTLFGIYLGLFMWGGLWFRDAGLRAMFPIRRKS